MGRVVFIAIIASLGVGFLLSAGHRASYEPRPPNLKENFETEILAAESALHPRPGTNKTFDWRFSDHRATPYALVQLHGWSASRQEISPVGETLARELGMNLFMTRLCGHGLGVEEMGKLTAECVLQDAEEAFAIGRKMGGKVVLLGTSTGASLAFALAREHGDAVAALVTVSPNFRPSQAASLLLKGPLGAVLAQWGLREHRWTPSHSNEEKYWTIGYPALALHELMDLLSWTNDVDLSLLKMPMIMFYTPDDRVVATEPMKDAFERYGGPKEIVEMKGAPHVLAGDVFNPAGTPVVVEKATAFLRSRLSENPGVPAQHQ